MRKLKKKNGTTKIKNAKNTLALPSLGSADFGILIGECVGMSACVWLQLIFFF